MDTQSTIITIASTIAGGGLGAWLTYKLGNRKQDQHEFVAVVAEYKGLLKSVKTEIDALRLEVAQVKADLADKEREIVYLRNQLLIFESSHADVPVPIWLKDTGGKMLFINPEYERELLHPIGKKADDYIMQHDDVIWGKETAGIFRKHDLKVMRTKKAEEFEESWHGTNGETWEGRVLKYPRFSGKTVVGIGGIIIERWVKGEK